jgi:hypothetical protein
MATGIFDALLVRANEADPHGTRLVLRLARACFRLHTPGRDGTLGVNEPLKSMMAMMGIPPGDDKEFQRWKKQ